MAARFSSAIYSVEQAASAMRDYAAASRRAMSSWLKLGPQ
jgi:hypothetical protein